jgi:hypothetical protein
LSVIAAYPNTPLAKRVKSEYLRITEAHQLPDGVPPEAVLFEVEQMFGKSPADDAADELLVAFEETVVRDAYQEAVAGLRRAEASGNPAAIESAQKACASISARLGALGR